MPEPKVSILMSVFNGQEYLRECVDSILGQTYRDFEFIIIDDGSDDRSPEILREYNDSRIRMFRQDNIGLTKSLNRAIGFSRGRYIARIDADEAASPDRLAAQVEFMDSNPDIGLVGSFCLNTNRSDRLPLKVETPILNKNIRKGLQRTNVIVHGSVMIRKEVFAAVGLYNEDFKYVQDYELWGRISKLYKMHNLPKFLLDRKTDSSLSTDKSVMKERALCSLKAHISTLKNLEKPFYSYFYLWPSILIYLMYILKIVKSPVLQKRDILKIFSRQ